MKNTRRRARDRAFDANGFHVTRGKRVAVMLHTWEFRCPAKDNCCCQRTAPAGSIPAIHLVHGGGRNSCARDRIGFAMRYISAETRCRSGVDSVTAIRGDCQRDYYELEPCADGEFTRAGLTALERALNFPSGFGEAKRTR